MFVHNCPAIEGTHGNQKSAQGETRTLMRYYPHRFLRPTRLPFRHPGYSWDGNYVSFPTILSTNESHAIHSRRHACDVSYAAPFVILAFSTGIIHGTPPNADSRRTYAPNTYYTANGSMAHDGKSSVDGLRWGALRMLTFDRIKTDAVSPENKIDLP